MTGFDIAVLLLVGAGAVTGFMRAARKEGMRLTSMEQTVTSSTPVTTEPGSQRRCHWSESSIRRTTSGARMCAAVIASQLGRARNEKLFVTAN